MYMYAYFNTPVVTSTLNGIGAWFNPMFEEFWPWGLIAIGIGMVFYLIKWIVGMFHNPLKH